MFLSVLSKPMVDWFITNDGLSTILEGRKVRYGEGAVDWVDDAVHQIALIEDVELLFVGVIEDDGGKHEFSSPFEESIKSVNVDTRVIEPPNELGPGPIAPGHQHRRGEVLGPNRLGGGLCQNYGKECNSKKEDGFHFQFSLPLVC